VQRILGYSPLEAGLAFLPVTAGIVIGSGLSQVLVKRFGARETTVFAMLLAVVLAQAQVGGALGLAILSTPAADKAASATGLSPPWRSPARRS
jgi:Na+/melibiose symporter-like transporter